MHAARFKRVYDSRKVQEVFHVEHGGAIEFDVKSRPLLIKGDVKVQFCDENTVRKKDKMCHFWVHSHFLLNQSQGRLHLRRANTDKACKGKYASRFPPEFEIILEAELDAEADVSSALSNDAEFGFGERHSYFVEGDGMDDLPEDTDTEDEEEEEAAAARRRAPTAAAAATAAMTTTATAAAAAPRALAEDAHLVRRAADEAAPRLEPVGDGVSRRRARIFRIQPALVQ